MSSLSLREGVEVFTLPSPRSYPRVALVLAFIALSLSGCLGRERRTDGPGKSASPAPSSASPGPKKEPLLLPNQRVSSSDEQPPPPVIEVFGGENPPDDLFLEPVVPPEFADDVPLVDLSLSVKFEQDRVRHLEAERDVVTPPHLQGRDFASLTLIRDTLRAGGATVMSGEFMDNDADIIDRLLDLHVQIRDAYASLRGYWDHFERTLNGALIQRKLLGVLRDGVAPDKAPSDPLQSY